MKKISFSLAILVLSLPACCPFDDCKCPNPIEFDLPLEVYGLQDTLSLGDTLRIKLEIPDRLAEQNSGVLYEFIDYDFMLKSNIDKIDTLPVGLGTIEYFDWTTTIGESKYDGGVFFVVPLYENHTYHYEVLITPKQKGLFLFAMGSISSRLHPLEKPEGPCSKYTVQVYPKLENETNVNFEFLQNSPEPLYANLDRKRFDEFAGFCFYVK